MSEQNQSHPVPRFEIRTQVAISGLRQGVMFVDGVGRTDDAKAAEGLRSIGYAVTDLKKGTKGQRDEGTK